MIYNANEQMYVADAIICLKMMLALKWNIDNHRITNSTRLVKKARLLPSMELVVAKTSNAAGLCTMHKETP